MAVTSSQVTVGAEPTRLTVGEGDAASGQRVTLYVPGATGVYIGGAAVTVASGLLVPAGASFSERLDPGEAVWAVAASGTAVVHVMQAGA